MSVGVLPPRLRTRIHRISRFGPSHAVPSCESRLLDWLQQRGWSDHAQRVILSTSEDGGRGLFALQQLREGNVAARVPISLAITPRVALDTPLGVAMSENLPAWSLIAAFLMATSKLLSDDDESSRWDGSLAAWGPYVESLPSRIDTVLELAADGSEALAYLRGSPSTLAALQIVRAFRASWDELRPGLQDAEERGIVPRGTADARLAVWAFAVALSRIARFASRPDIEALVPWIDMFNHSPNARSFIDLAGTQEVVVQADRAYRPGDEVFISYGQKSSSELLLSYGFAPVHHECDSAWVPLGLPPSPSRSGGDEHRQRVVRALAARGDFLTATRSDVVELSEDFAVLLVRVGAAGQVPEGVMQAALCVAACEGVPGADVKAWVDRTMSLPEDRLTKEHTALAAGTLADACSLALKGFARKMQDNVDLLRSMETAGGAAAAAPREAPHQPSPSRPMSTGRPQAKCAPSGAGDDRGRSMEATVTALLPSWAAVGSTNAGKGRAASPAPSGARRRGKRADPSPAGAEAPDERDRRVAVQVLRAVVAEQRVIAGAEFALRRFVRSASR